MTSTNYKSLGKRHILLAEDVELNQQLARHMMENWGFQVDIASNGQEALGLVQKNDYDLVLMDIHMPEMDGMEATVQIRQLADKKKAAIPIVALTANALKGDRERFLAAGMSDYLPKPIEESKLFSTIANNLSDMIITTDQPSIQEVVAADNTPASNKLYNLAMVQGIAGGDDSFIKRMLQLFLDTMPLTVKELQEETGRENWQQVGKLAHKLKSTIDSMGIVSLKETVRQVEQYGKKDEHPELIPALVNLIDAVLMTCAAQVKKDFSL